MSAELRLYIPQYRDSRRPKLTCDWVRNASDSKGGVAVYWSVQGRMGGGRASTTQSAENCTGPRPHLHFRLALCPIPPLGSATASAQSLALSIAASNVFFSQFVGLFHVSSGHAVVYRASTTRPPTYPLLTNDSPDTTPFHKPYDHVIHPPESGCGCCLILQVLSVPSRSRSCDGAKPRETEDPRQSLWRCNATRGPLPLSPIDHSLIRVLTAIVGNERIDQSLGLRGPFWSACCVP